MKKRRITALSVLIAVILIFLTGCPGNGEPEKMAVDVDGFGWHFRNYDPQYLDLIWGDPPFDSTCYLDFSLWYTGTEVQPGDLTSFTAECGDVVFTVPVSQNIFLDSANDPERHGLSGYYVYKINDSSHYMPLGPWTFTLDFIDGSETVVNHTFPKPGSANTQDNAFAVTEDYPAADSNHFSMVKRAVISSATYDSSSTQLSVQFTVNDLQAYSGWINVIDENGDNAASSIVFINGLGEVSDELSGSFYTDGSINTFTANLSNYSGAAIDENLNHYAVVYVSDGLQYTQTGTGIIYDCYSASAPMLVTAP